MEKKYIKSKLVIALYVVAALLLIYGCYLIGSTIAYVISYYSSYSMSPAFSETVGYVLQAAYQPLVLAAIVFAGAKILNEVRMLNPGYYATEEEIAAAKAAKKAAKEKKENTKAEETVEAEAKEEEPDEKTVKANASMKKDELLAIAKEMGIEVPAKATKADILAAINK